MIVLALLSGVLQTVVFPHASQTWLAAICLVPLLIAIQDQQPKRCFLFGWLAGTVFWGGTCYWIYPVMRDYASIAPPVAAILYLAFAMVKGLHGGVFGLLSGPFLKRSWGAAGIAILWVAIEGTHQYMGFTWTHLGHAAMDFPLPHVLRLATWTGVYGPSLVFALINATIALSWIRRSAQSMVWLTPLVLLFLLPGLPEIEATPETARLVQPNVHPDELKTGWSPSRGTEHLSRMLELSTTGQPPTLLVWPEYPVPAFYFDSIESRRFLERVASEAGAPFIFNTISFKDGDRLSPQNSSVTLAANGLMLSRYSKMHLVPFGEFVPWPFSYFVEKITMQAGSFKRGEEVAVADVDGRGVGTFICYESVFARSIRRFTAQGAEVLVNISNDSWYGRSAARFQHLLIARMRAVENGRWILRATNDGLTTAIDPAGNIRQEMPSHEQGVMEARFAYRQDLTGFVRWGEWLWWLTLAVSAASIATQKSIGTKPGG